jgi:predicted NBD/HSP70 family sugar kinase
MSFSNVDPSVGDHVVGIDLGGSYVRALLCDLDGREVGGAVEPTPNRDADAVIEAVAGLARTVAERADVDFARVAGVAVGIPAVAHPTAGTLRLAPNLPAFGDRDVVGALRDELAVPVAIDNDVNMATRAEHRRGLGAGTRDFAFIAVGTGVGMGIVAGGQLQRGATGAAGEVAMLPLGADPFDPAHHDNGSLEEVAGGAGLARRYARRTGADVAPAGELDLFAAAADGDAHAAELVAQQTLALALAVVAVHSVLDPALVVFGGGIGSRPDVVARVRAHLPGLTTHAIRVEASALGERAGLIGAAELARELAAPDLDAVGGER